MIRHMPSKPGQLQPPYASRADRLLFRETDNRMLAIFRMLFGLLMAMHCILAILKGQVYRNFISPPFTFNYIGFDFLQPLPGQGMYIFFSLMALAALMVMIGYRYRFCSLVMACMWTIIYLMQKMDYNNHYYLMVLLCWMMAFVPAHHRFSVDAHSGFAEQKNVCRQWVPILFIGLLAIMYVFAGISKFDPDWLSGRFLEIMFSRYRNHTFLSGIYSNSGFALLISYAGLLFDLLIVPALLWKKTRNAAFLLSCCFHLFNSYTFHVGIFPYLGIALNLFFYMPIQTSLKEPQSITTGHTPYQRLIRIALPLFLTIQLLLPLRHFIFPGNVFWTDEGYRMSWKMMGRTKSGWVKFKVTDAEGRLKEYIDPAKELSTTHCMWLAGSPDMIWQYAQRTKKKYQDTNNMRVKVFAVGEVSLNRRKPQPLIDSTINLAEQTWQPFRHSAWILPFHP